MLSITLPAGAAPAPAGTDLTAEQRAALDAFAAMDRCGDAPSKVSSRGNHIQYLA